MSVNVKCRYRDEKKQYHISDYYCRKSSAPWIVIQFDVSIQRGNLSTLILIITRPFFNRKKVNYVPYFALNLLAVCYRFPAHRHYSRARRSSRKKLSDAGKISFASWSKRQLSRRGPIKLSMA